MPTTKAYAAFDAKSPLAPFELSRRDPKPNDVTIDITYCGICHSDLHQARNEWQNASYPMVPGHEIVGRVIAVGSAVTKLEVGQIAGVGCMVDSCRRCSACERGLEQYCEEGMSLTYNGFERDKKTPTHGGYSKQIVVDERYVVAVRQSGSLEGVAPLLCAGITTYSPLRHWKVGKGTRVGVVGLGGLGHVAVKLAAAMGAEVTLFSSSDRKRDDAKRLGAHEYVVSTDAAQMAKHHGRLDFILNTVSAEHDLTGLLLALRLDGTMVMVGAPEKPLALPVFPLLMNRRAVAGSGIGGIAETQEMLDFCAKHQITADVEVIPIQKVNEAYERLVKADVRYRFVIDNATLEA
ncbi:MAG: NAD(P)-dependent alcohol dehydrogenase [Labilithrix sp.]|nr:NAD(P)-dependent alcohol dehydrogenase [Labilithrix sp.]